MEGEPQQNQHPSIVIPAQRHSSGPSTIDTFGHGIQSLVVQFRVPRTCHSLFRYPIRHSGTVSNPPFGPLPDAHAYQRAIKIHVPGCNTCHLSPSPQLTARQVSQDSSIQRTGNPPNLNLYQNFGTSSTPVSHLTSTSSILRLSIHFNHPHHVRPHPTLPPSLKTSIPIPVPSNLRQKTIPSTMPTRRSLHIPNFPMPRLRHSHQPHAIHRTHHHLSSPAARRHSPHNRSYPALSPRTRLYRVVQCL